MPSRGEAEFKREVKKIFGEVILPRRVVPRVAPRMGLKKDDEILIQALELARRRIEEIIDHMPVVNSRTLDRSWAKLKPGFEIENATSGFSSFVDRKLQEEKVNRSEVVQRTAQELTDSELLEFMDEFAGERVKAALEKLRKAAEEEGGGRPPKAGTIPSSFTPI